MDTKKLETSLETVEIKQTRDKVEPIRFRDETINKIKKEYNSARENYYDTSFKPKCTNYYGGDDPPAVDNRPVDYYWTEPKQKDPGADYKPGKFKYLDEAIKNTKKDS